MPELTPEHGELWPGLLDALKPIARDRRGNLNPTNLGHWLRDNRDRVLDVPGLGQLKLKRQGSSTRPAWSVEDKDR